MLPVSPSLAVVIGEARQSFFFCTAASNYTYAGVVYASTTSKVADFSPPNRNVSMTLSRRGCQSSATSDNSARVAVDGEEPFLSHTQLGWDQSADIGVGDVSRLDHVMGYGRPL